MGVFKIASCAGPEHDCNHSGPLIWTDDSPAARWKATEACVRVRLRRGQQPGLGSASALYKARPRWRAGQACAACCPGRQSSDGRRAAQAHGAVPEPRAQEGVFDFKQDVSDHLMAVAC